MPFLDSDICFFQTSLNGGRFLPLTVSRYLALASGVFGTPFLRFLSLSCCSGGFCFPRWASPIFALVAEVCLRPNTLHPSPPSDILTRGHPLLLPSAIQNISASPRSVGVSDRYSTATLYLNPVLRSCFIQYFLCLFVSLSRCFFPACCPGLLRPQDDFPIYRTFPFLGSINA